MFGIQQPNNNSVTSLPSCLACAGTDWSPGGILPCMECPEGADCNTGFPMALHGWWTYARTNGVCEYLPHHEYH